VSFKCSDKFVLGEEQTNAKRKCWTEGQGDGVMMGEWGERDWGSERKAKSAESREK
jgi:hypothetical protein